MQLKFYKKNDRWYADVPGHTEEENEMVSGSDTFLNLYSNWTNEAIIEFTNIPRAANTIFSIEYIRRSAEVSALLGAKTMVVHCGSCAKISRETAMGYARETLEGVALMMQENDFKTIVGIETMGKVNQLGTLDEVIELCKISPCFAPVVDFGHLNARDRGVFYTVDDYKRVFDRIASELGSNYAEDLHCHFSKIMFTEMGEKKHLTFEDDVYGPNFEPLAEAIVSLGVAPTIICESAGTQSHDAAFMKLTYEKLRQN